MANQRACGTSRSQSVPINPVTGILRRKGRYPRARLSECANAIGNGEITDERAIEIVTKILRNDEDPSERIRRDWANDGVDQVNRSQRDAIKHLQESEFGKAAKALERGGVKEITPEVQRMVERLYPTSTFDPNEFEGSQYQQALDASEEEIRGALKKMKLSAPGPSKVDIKTLEMIIFSDQRITICFRKVINILLGGRPGWDDPRLSLLVEARGIPLAKDDNKVRPIAVNESMTNLISRIALDKCTDKIMAVLDPLDLGFNRAGGTEAAVHSIRGMYHMARRDKKKFVVVQTDFTNAFNSVSREAVFNAVSATCPELIPFLRFRYRGMNVIFGNERDGNSFKIMSETGVSQGCPMSPALFQLVMSRTLQVLRSTSLSC